MAMALASPDTQLTGIDRAAILIMALDRAVARQLLQQMDTDEIRRVALAMAEIDKVEPGVLEKVVADFIRELYEVSLMPHSGGEFVKNVLPDLLDERRREVAQQRPRVLAPAVREGRRDEDRAHRVPLARLEELGHGVELPPRVGAACGDVTGRGETARRRARGGAGVSGGAGEGARTRSNGRFTRVVNRKAASPSSATPAARLRTHAAAHTSA